MRMKKPYPIAYWIVDLVTLANAACGVLAVFFLVKFVIFRNVNEFLPLTYLTLVWLFMFFGGIFDWLDGTIARSMRISTELGKELDSLCNAVTFGVVPAMIIAVLNNSGASLYWEIFAWVSAAVYLSCALFRLARFDVETLTEEKHHFKFRGMPMPTAAGMVGAFLLLYVSLHDGSILFVRILWEVFSKSSVIQFSDYLITALPFLGLILAFCMVSNTEHIHFISLLKFFRDRKIFEYLFYLATALLLVVLLREMVLIFLVLFFVLYGPVMYFYNLLTRKSKKSSMPA